LITGVVTREVGGCLVERSTEPPHRTHIISSLKQPHYLVIEAATLRRGMPARWGTGTFGILLGMQERLTRALRACIPG
jgi:hypothetical protein